MRWSKWIPPTFRDDFAPVDVHARDLGENHGRVPLPAKNAADRRRNVRRRKAGGGNLIKQRLEQMVIVAIDDNDFEGSPGEGLGGGEPTRCGGEGLLGRNGPLSSLRTQGDAFRTLRHKSTIGIFRIFVIGPPAESGRQPRQYHAIP
jgi:hypothetical protein